MTVSRNRALFLDRDGVINVDHAYVHKKEDFEFIDGIFDLCRYAKQAGYLIVVVTNQAGIGRGYYTEQDFHILTEWMCKVFLENGAGLDKVYFCPSHPEFGVGEYKVDSMYRKPNPGMLLQAKHELGIDMARSLLVGDKNSDIDAGMRAGVGQNLLYLPSFADAKVKNNATAVVSRLTEIIQLL